jgi:chemotaxis protein methyltransferase CheR
VDVGTVDNKVKIHSGLRLLRYTGRMLPPEPRHESAARPDEWTGPQVAVAHVPAVGAALSFEHVVFAGERDEPARRYLPVPRRRSAPQPSVQAARPVDSVSENFFAWVCGRHGLEVGRYRPAVFRRRTGACLRAVRAESVARAWQLLEVDTAKTARVIDALMIGVTEFFRDREVFQALEALLPGLAIESPPEGMRILSVGCSDGSELYSVAILLAERGLLGPARGQLWGIDCRSAAIAAATRGVYAEGALSGLPTAWRELYFEGAAGGRRIIEPLRAACRWETGDAFSSPERQVDLLLCRNLAIYLEPEATRELWVTCASRLRNGGVLVVGKAERPAVEGLDRIGPCLYRKVEVPA